MRFLLLVYFFVFSMFAFSANGAERRNFTVKSKDKFGIEREYLTGYVPPTLEEKLGRNYREFPANKGAYAFKEIPKELDLRQYVQRIFRQRAGDCWAQANATAFETTIAWVDKISTFVSRQQIIDCSGYGSAANGGQISVGMYKKIGAAYEVEYPYVGRDQKCKTNMPQHQKAEDVFFMKDNDTVQDYQRAMLETQSAFEVCGASRALANGGWVTSNGGGGIDHCYGWAGWLDGESHGKPPGIYFIFPNSWGSDWGDNGFAYVRVAKDNIHFDGNVLVEGAGFNYKPACTPQPVADAGKEKSILLEAK